MENDRAFEADAELDALERNLSGSSHSTRNGHEAIQAVVGGFESQQERDHAESPLLPKQPGQNRSDSDQAVLVDEEDGSSQEWSGAHDFDGLPWWKRPSVSHRDIESHMEEARTD